MEIHGHMHPMIDKVLRQENKKKRKKYKLKAKNRLRKIVKNNVK